MRGYLLLPLFYSAQMSVMVYRLSCPGSVHGIDGMILIVLLVHLSLAFTANRASKIQKRSILLESKRATSRLLVLLYYCCCCTPSIVPGLDFIPCGSNLLPCCPFLLQQRFIPNGLLAKNKKFKLTSGFLPKIQVEISRFPAKHKIFTSDL